jgi:hypothetical protein
MYRTTRRLEGHPAHMEQRIATVMAVLERVNSHHGGQLACLVPVGGDPGLILVVGNYAHLADYEKTRAAMASDTELPAIMAAAAGMTTSVQDTIAKVIVESGEPTGWVSANSARMHMPRVVEAMTLGIEIAEYVKKLTGRQVGFSNAITGDRSRVTWGMMAKDMADIEAIGDQTENDPGYMALFARSEGLFVDGSLDAHILQRLG